MKRRTFIKTSSIASIVPLYYFKKQQAKTHFLSLSWDDGFRKSFYKVAEIHQEYGLKANLNIIASGHHTNFRVNDDWISGAKLGNFEDWNNLVGQGHTIMPHSWQHLNHARISASHAKENIDKCLEYFEKNLDGYQSTEAVYVFPYNSATPELEEYILTKVRAIRSWGRYATSSTEYNPIPSAAQPAPLGCQFYGPKNGDQFVQEAVDQFLASDGGWLIINLHGFGNEGWGPLSVKFYDRLLQRLVKIEKLDVLPVADVLKLYA